MNNVDFKLGFVKRAMEYGLPESQAIRLVKQAVDFDLNNALEAAKSGWNNLNPAAKGALVGGGLGLAGGALNSGEDEHGETHRLRNALLGGVGGAAVGAGGAHFYDKYKHYFNKLTSKENKNQSTPSSAYSSAYGNNTQPQLEESVNQIPNVVAGESEPAAKSEDRPMPKELLDYAYREKFPEIPAVDNTEMYGSMFDEAAQKDVLGDDYNESAESVSSPEEEELSNTIKDPPDEYEYPTTDEQLSELARTRKIVAENERNAKLPFISRKLDALKQLAELDKARRNIGVNDYSDAGRRNRMTEMRARE